MTTATDEHARIGMNSNTSLHYSARRLGICVGLKLLTVTNAALYFVLALLHLGLRIPLGFWTVSVPEPIPRRRWWRLLSERVWQRPRWHGPFMRVANGD